RSFEGVAPAADLTVYTPDTVWMQIARGELDGERALREGLYRAGGDYGLLSKIPEWFPARRGGGGRGVAWRASEGAPPALPLGRRRGKCARPHGALGALEGRGGGAPADATPPTLNWVAAPP